MFHSNNILKKVICATLFSALLACANERVDPIDSGSGMSREDIEKNFVKDPKANKLKKAQKSQDETPIPNVSKLIMTPPPPTIGGDKTISFSVNDQVPLKDVLIELGRIAKIDIDLDSGISGGIIVNAKNRPLKEVIDRIATSGNLRYSYKNGVLRFERDAPYMKNYFVDYLTGSAVWTDVESNITAVLGASGSSSESAPTSSFTTNKSAGIISVYATQAQHENVTKYLDEVYRLSSAQVLIEAKVIEVTLNKEFHAGIDWNWFSENGGLTFNTGTFGGTPGATSVFAGISDPPTLTLKNIFGIKGGDLNATIRLLEKFGETKAISSPRINAINNQAASLDFTQTYIYFTISTSASTVAGTTNPTTASSVTATKNEIPIGVQLSITPSINLATNEVTLDVKPKLSVLAGTVRDPSVNPQTGDSLNNTVPLINNRTLNTVAKIQSGNILVIGGLMSDTSDNADTGVPFLSRIPILGYLFKYSKKTSTIVETVIFIKATIVNSGTVPNKVDRDLQEKFDVNRRQFFQ